MRLRDQEKQKQQDRERRVKQLQERSDKRNKERKAEMERKVRSDLVTEEDMMRELQETLEEVAAGPGEAAARAGKFLKSKQFRSSLEKSLQEAMEETQREMGGMELEPGQKQELGDLVESLEQLKVIQEIILV